MRLTGDTFKQLHDALLDAFKENSLRALLRIQLETDLDRIVQPDALEMRVENLIHSAEQNSCLPDLLTAAKTANPTNKKLAAVELAYLPDDTDTAVPHRNTAPARDTLTAQTTSIEAGHAEGAITTGTVTTGGGDLAGRDIDKSTTTTNQYITLPEQPDLFPDVSHERIEALSNPALRLSQAQSCLEDMSGAGQILAEVLALSLVRLI